MARRCFLLRKRSIPFLMLAALLYFVARPMSFPTLLQYNRPAAPPPTVQRDTIPTYEFQSLYRAHAPAEVEAELEKALLAIEYEITNGAVLKGPAKIWQIGTPDMAKQWESLVEQWRINNPEWEHAFIFDDVGEEFVHETFKSMPTLVKAFDEFSMPVLKADVLRYMLLWFHGGLYADVDTWNRMALRDCAPMQEILQERVDVSLLVGVEIDEPYLSAATMEAWHWSRNFGFSQFAIYAPQRFDPILRTAIVRAVSHSMVHEHESGWLRSVEGKRYGEGDILEVTGPGMFTDVVLDILNESLTSMHGLRDRNAGLENRVTWKGFHALRNPVWIPGRNMENGRGKGRGVGILPINVWGNGQRHSGSGTFNEDSACINHIFGRTWKKGWWEWAFG